MTMLEVCWIQAIRLNHLCINVIDGRDAIIIEV